MYKQENLIGYSLALFSIAKEENKVNKYLLDAKTLLSIFSDYRNSAFIDILSSNNLDTSKKDEIIDKTFKDLSNKHFLNFLKLLASKNKFQYINKIMNTFIKYCSENLKIKEGIIYSSSSLSEANVKAIEKKVSNKLNYKVSLKNLLDKELISGIKIIIENTIIENSIISDLDKIKQILKGVK